MFKPEQLVGVFKEIVLEHKFEFPIHWVMVGAGGVFLTGKLTFSILRLKLDFSILSGRAKDLRFPINMMLVDKTGKAAHVLFKRAGEAHELNRLGVDEPPPEVPPPWPSGVGKA